MHHVLITITMINKCNNPNVFVWKNTLFLIRIIFPLGNTIMLYLPLDRRYIQRKFVTAKYFAAGLMIACYIKWYNQTSISQQIQNICTIFGNVEDVGLTLYKCVYEWEITIILYKLKIETDKTVQIKNKWILFRIGLAFHGICQEKTTDHNYFVLREKKTP